MIDWQKTGKDASTSKSSDKVIVVCEGCNKIRPVTYSRVRHKSTHPCLSCSQKPGIYSTGQLADYKCIMCGLVKQQKYRRRTFENWKCSDCLAPQKSENIKKALADPTTKAKLANAMEKLRQDPDHMNKIRMAGRRQWEDPQRLAIHIEAMSRPEVRAKISAASKSYWSNQANRTAASIVGKKLRKDPVYRAMMDEVVRIYRGDPDKQAAASATSKALWQDPSYRANAVAASKSQWQDPSFVAKAVATSKALWSDQSYRTTITVALKEAWKDQTYRATMIALAKSRWEVPAYKARMTAVSKKLWTNERIRSRIIAAQQAKWKDPAYREKMATIRSNHPRISSIQVLLYKYLDDLCIEYKPESRETAIGHYVFDCLIPGANNRKNLLIECQGDYWHSLARTQNNDKSKFTYIDRYFPDHEIMYIWEHEFYAKDRVIDRIKQKLGIDLQSIDFNFTDVQYKEPPSRDLKSFLNAYHYLGKDRGGKTYGAYLGNLLIGVVVYSPPLRQNTATQFGLVDGEVRELSRLCIHPSYHRKNFASWLISKSIKILSDAKLIIAYADSTVGHTGTIYKASNFKLDHEVPPDYWYVDRSGFVMHKRTLYGRASAMKMSETEFANHYGYMKQWGGMKHCYIKAINH